MLTRVFSPLHSSPHPPSTSPAHVLHALPPRAWQAVMDECVFPLLQRLGADPLASPPITRSRILAAELLSKLFLRYLPALLAMRSRFHLTFLNTLTAFERYVHLGRGTQARFCELIFHPRLCVCAHRHLNTAPNP